MKIKRLAPIFALIGVCIFTSLMFASCGPQGNSADSDDSFSDELTEKTAIETEPFYVLVVGDDSRKDTASWTGKADDHGQIYTHSDVIMLVRVDPTSHKISLVSVPRDTKDTVNGTTCKINEAYTQGGIMGLREHIEALTGVEIKYHLICAFKQFHDLINELGGLTVNVPIDQAMTDVITKDYLTFPAGEQTLNGSQALIFARERKKYNPNGEVYRQTNDRYIVQTIIQNILSNPEGALDTTEALLQHVDTDWSIVNLKAHVADFVEHSDEVSFISGTGPYEGDTDPETQLWLTFRDEETWHEVMNVVDAGGDPNSVVASLSALQ